MPPRRRIPTRGTLTPLEEPEQHGSVEMRELRALMAQLAEDSRQQRQRIDRLLAQREVPPPTILEAPAPPVVPFVPTAPSSSSGALGAAQPMTPAEEEMVVEKLTRFRHFDPPRFSGRNAEPWEVKAWIAAMEKLFMDFFIQERYRVHMAVHCLDGDADAWWRRVEPVEFQTTRQLPWFEFRSMLFGAYFSSSVKQKLEDDLMNLQQGSRPMQEYLREFMRLLNYMPFVALYEPHRVHLFEIGLRAEIYTLVHAQRLQTLNEAIEQAL